MADAGRPNAVNEDDDDVPDLLDECSGMVML